MLNLLLHFHSQTNKCNAAPLFLFYPAASAAWLDVLSSYSSETTSPDYSSVLSSPPSSSPSSSSSSSLHSPPGFTRSLVGLDYSLITPESRTWAAPVNSALKQSKDQSWSNASVAHLVSPGRAASGAAFSMYLVKLGGHGRLGPPPPASGAERFVFVLDGVVRVESESRPPSSSSESPSRRQKQQRRRRCSPQQPPRGGSSGGSGSNFTLRADGFAFFPPHCAGLSPAVSAGPGGAGLLVFERIHVSRATGKPSKGFDDGAADENAAAADDDADDEEEALPSFVYGRAASELPLLDPGHPETFKLRKLLPHSGPEASRFDLNVHLMDFDPGEFLVTKEIHHNQHGLLMLLGQGIYRLSNAVWSPVVAGDAIYMGPYVTQWFGALGREKSRYIIFKDTAPDPLLGGGGFS